MLCLLLQLYELSLDWVANISLRKQTCFCLYDLVDKIIMSCNIECEILMLYV